MKRWFWTLVLIGATLPCGVAAEQPKPADVPEDPAHNELRKLRDGLTEAFNKRDLDKMVQHLHPNVVVTWQNGEVSRGHDGFRAYYKKMMEGDKKIVDTITGDPSVDELSIIHNGNSAIAFGNLNDQYKLKDGMEFNLKSRWTATAIKDGDKWLVTSFHASTNAFDNEVMRIAIQKVMIWSGVVAGASGFVLGLLVAWFVRKLRGKPMQQGA